ncbi:MAG: cytochrome c biogenesis protein CcdA [Paracoccaceae bacterium]|nr:cytochrome c biogenesis protein CcdA [Paracoccaceae bacterium]
MFFDISFGGAALAGILSFFSPCVLPLVPFYFGYMAGISMSELRDEGIAPGAQRRLVISAVFFALGVTTIFVLMGLGATALGQAFRSWMQPLSYVAAALLLVFGLHFIGLVRIPLLYRQAKIESTAAPSTVIGAYLMGLAFGFGWTPCVGPALAAILMIASAQDSLFKGGMLLLVYGLSMTLPFVIGSFFARPFLNWMQSKRKYLGHVEKVMGGLLILFAVLIATNSVSRISQFLIDYFPGLLSIG